MNILTIDTVLDKTYISFLINGREIYRTLESDENNYHSAYLSRTILNVLEEEKISLKEIDFIGVNTGTGSFTGIRVALAFVKVISNRLNIKAVPFETVEVLTLAYKNKNIMLDARRGSIFYSNDGLIFKMISCDEGQKILKNSSGVFVCDNSLKEKFQDFSDKLVSYEKEGLNLAKVELELVKNKIKEGKTTDANEIKPVYIQTPPIFSKS